MSPWKPRLDAAEGPFPGRELRAPVQSLGAPESKGNDDSDPRRALETACPFDPLEPAACDRPAVGVCGPVRGELERWTCQCEGNAEPHPLQKRL